MRADRLVSLVLLLRQHGRMTATALARELEVSTRTVLRDVEALSAAGVPVYAERGRHGGFALLPGFRTELTGLTTDEALALLVVGARRGAQALGLGSALASAVLKVVDALPEPTRTTAAGAARRVLVEPATDLLERRTTVDDDVPAAVLAEVRRALFAGRRLRLRYAAGGAVGRPGAPAESTAGDSREASAAEDGTWRTVDPVGLVTVRGRAYLLATRDGEDRTYRLDRVRAAEPLDEPARSTDGVDLDRIWRERAARFRTAGDLVTARLRVAPRRAEALAGTALTVRAVDAADAGAEPSDPVADEAAPWGRVVDAVYQDAGHALWTVWSLGGDALVLDPPWLRAALHARAAALAARYADETHASPAADART